MRIFYFASVQLGRADAANRHVHGVCNHLAERGHQISLFVPFRRSPSTALHPGVRIITVPALFSGGLFFTTLSFYLALPWWSFRHFLRLRPLVIYTRASFLDWIPIALLHLFFKFAYIAELNGIRSMETQGGVLKRCLIAWQERLSLRLCHGVIGVTHERCQWAVETGKLRPKQTAIIGNGVSTDLFRPMPSADAGRILGLEPNIQYLNFTGSLKSWHDTKTLIQALPTILAKLLLDVRLLIVGDGPEKIPLMKLARQLDVDCAINWIGLVPIHRVPLYINASEVCLAPFTLERNSRTGTSPLKIFEYMSCGRPFVTTRIGIAFDDEIESCRCGILVPPEDPIALGKAVVQLLNNPEQRQRLRQRGRQTAVDHYSWATIAERTELFITQSV